MRWMIAAWMALSSLGYAQTVVVFGVTGDLTKRGLVPALVRLSRSEKLPDPFTFIGVGLGSDDVEQLSHFVPDSQRTEWEKIKDCFSLILGRFEDASTFEALGKRLQELPGEKLFYLATPPNHFSLVIDQLHKHGLLDDKVRLVVEKPFGLDLATAENLQKKLTTVLKESQIFRMDHFLGLEIARQLVSLRFSNLFLEQIWNKENIDHVSITISETLGIGTRGLFWENTGYLKDVVQNHMMQLVSLIAMERPATFSPEVIQQEKCRVLQTTTPVFVVGGQYREGSVEGQSVKGYREEKNVSPCSLVETAIVGKLLVDNERWAGVPFYLKGGKRLSQECFEIAIFLRSKENLPPDRLVFQIQPVEEIALWSNTLDSEGNLQSHKVNFPLKTDLSSMPAAYETLLYEAMKGDQSHFASFEEIALSWNLFAPVFSQWEQNPLSRAKEYSAGSEGPKFEEVHDEHR